MQELQDHGGFHLDCKGKPGVQAMYDRVRVLKAGPEKVVHEAVSMKFKLQWSPQDVEMPGKWSV
jgi:hypothetical protein